MILGWYSWGRNVSKNQKFLRFCGGTFQKNPPPKAEELFYFVRVPPLKLQHTQQRLMEYHKKKSKEIFLR
jgi:hypothetical protein